MKTLFDEADYIIPQQVESTIRNGSKDVTVVCADTDVFVLLCAMYANRCWWEAEVYMEDFTGEKNMISIRRTVEKYSQFIDSSPRLNRLWYCAYDIWNWKNEIRKYSFKATTKVPWQTNADITSVLHEGKSFLAQCYGLNETDSSKSRFVYKIFNLGLKIVIGAEGFILNV